MYEYEVDVIRLTRLNKKEFILNAELILYVEETPDTVITLQNREKLVVLEKSDEVRKRTIEYARLIRAVPGT